MTPEYRDRLMHAAQRYKDKPDGQGAFDFLAAVDLIMKEIDERHGEIATVRRERDNWQLAYREAIAGRVDHIVFRGEDAK